MVKSFWWPIQLTPAAADALRSFRSTMAAVNLTVDHSTVTAVADLLAIEMASHVNEIIERDGLPHLAHVINGWGNACYNGHRLMDEIGPFIHNNQDGLPVVLQCDPEGEFHPWQSFAYAVMAGVDADESLSGSGVTLRELALNSRMLNTSRGRELGHLLFALPNLDPDMDGPLFSLRGKTYSIFELMEVALHSHHYGGFEVCRKFHLTEGLCAMAAMVPDFNHYRSDSQGFLNGQMDMALLLGMILEETVAFTVDKKQPTEEALMFDLRKSLSMGNEFENHMYYAGHIIELACIAIDLGYKLNQEHRSTIAYIIKTLNEMLPVYLPHISFLDCFLALGHYRRSVTMWIELEKANSEGRALTRYDLMRYSADFNSLTNAKHSVSNTDKPEAVSMGVYDFIEPKNEIRPEFAIILEVYASSASYDLRPRGHFPHFRRIGPPSWPRAFHYELLDYGDKVGVEIHLENDGVLPLRESLLALGPSIANSFSERQTGWDPNWYRERGRMVVIFEADEPPEVVSRGMHKLIACTMDQMDPLASSLRLDPLALGIEFTLSKESETPSSSFSS
jgi:hypothetical protein